MNSIIYRCGWCGCPTNKDGQFLKDDDHKRVASIVEAYGDHRTKQTNGECCEDEMRQQEREQVQVTREMARDAGFPEMEGQWITW